MIEAVPSVLFAGDAVSAYPSCDSCGACGESRLWFLPAPEAVREMESHAAARGWCRTRRADGSPGHACPDCSARIANGG